jgi:hypothetical protein
MAASVFAATAGAVALLNRTYEKVWGGSASKTIKGKETATKHFNKFLLSVGVEQELNQWTIRTARDILSIEFIQMFGGYISEATSFDTGDLLMRDTALQYFSGVKTVLVHMFARKFKESSDVLDQRMFNAFFEEKVIEEWNSKCRAGISQIISSRCIENGTVITTKAPHLGK